MRLREPVIGAEQQPERWRLYPKGLITLLSFVAWSPVGITPPDWARASASPSPMRCNGPSATGSDGGSRTVPAATCSPRYLTVLKV